MRLFATELLAFAYLANCRCDPTNTIDYFTSLSAIVKEIEASGHGHLLSQLAALISTELSRGRFTRDEVVQAASTLGFGADGSLRLDYDDEIEDEFVINAWKDCIKRSWLDSTDRDPGTTQRMANDAFKVLAQTRGSLKMVTMWEQNRDAMTPEKAYDTLEVPRDVDDLMLITIYNMRVWASTFDNFYSDGVL
jgi:ubiquitin carboxyl-terminal hydrolase 25